MPAGALLSRYSRLPGETEVADGHHALLATPMHAIPVGEGVELFKVAQRVVCLVLHPGTSAHRWAAVGRGDGPRRRAPTFLDREHARLIGPRDQNRREFD